MGVDVDVEVELIVFVAGFEVRQDLSVSRCVINAEEAGGQSGVRAFVVVQRKANLLEIILALSPAGCFAGLLDRRQQQGHKDGDDGNHHQQFDQGKSATFHADHSRKRHRGTQTNRSPDRRRTSGME